MTSAIIHDPSFRHGTPDGFRDGCHGSHCPADMTCRDVHLRYMGDWAYRRAIDSGLTSTDIHNQEQEALQQARDARERRVRVILPKKRKQARTITPAGQHASLHTDAVRRLHAQGLLDAEIGRTIGLGRRQVTTIRAAIGLTPNRNINTDTIRELHAQGMTDTEITAHINQDRARKTNRRAIAAIRHRLGLAPNQAPVTTGASSLPKEAT